MLHPKSHYLSKIMSKMRIDLVDKQIEMINDFSVRFDLNFSHNLLSLKNLFVKVTFLF